MCAHIDNKSHNLYLWWFIPILKIIVPSPILVIHCCVTNDPKTWCLETSICYCLWFWGLSGWLFCSLWWQLRYWEGWGFTGLDHPTWLPHSAGAQLDLATRVPPYCLSCVSRLPLLCLRLLTAWQLTSEREQLKNKSQETQVGTARLLMIYFRSHAASEQSALVKASHRPRPDARGGKTDPTYQSMRGILKNS